MTAYVLEQAVSGVWHMAVVTFASGRADGVVSVLRDFSREFVVALQAGGFSFHARGQLVVWFALVHRMARQAGKLPLLITG